MATKAMMDAQGTAAIGRVFDIQGFSVHDGPGIRMTVFLKGCPLRCLWCHSPESQAFPPELNHMDMKCAGVEACGRCIGACKKGAIAAGGRRAGADGEITVTRVDRSVCDDCGDCAGACPTKALYICGTEYTVGEAMEKVRRDKPFYDTSGGGVTFSGGECMCQPAFLRQMLMMCKAEGIHTAVDTSGFCEWEALESVLPYTDLFLYDLKHMDSAMHEKGTGVPNGRILDNARRIAAAGGRFQIRIPLIPLYNDSERDMDAFGEFIKGLGGAVDVVQLLPYHKLGIVKWERLSKGAPVIEAEPPSEELVQGMKRRLESYGLKVTIH